MNKVVEHLNNKMCLYCTEKASTYMKKGEIKKGLDWLKRSIYFASPAERQVLKLTLKCMILETALSMTKN